MPVADAARDVATPERHGRRTAAHAARSARPTPAANLYESGLAWPATDEERDPFSGDGPLDDDAAPASEPEPSLTRGGARLRDGTRSVALHVVFLADRANHASLRSYLKKRVPAGWVDDLLQLVLAKGLAAKNPPVDPAKLEAWVRRIAQGTCVDQYRRAEVRHAEEHDPGRGCADEVASGGIDELGPDRRRAVEAVVQDPEDAIVLGWMGRHYQEGESYKAIAKEAGLSFKVVEYRVARLAKKLAKLSGVLLAVFLLIWFGASVERGGGPRDRKHDEVAMPGEIGPDDAAAVRPAAPVVSAGERAGRLRARGLEECRVGRYQACLEALDEARGVDPAGEGEERVREARRVAGEALGVPGPEEGEKEKRR